MIYRLEILDLNGVILSAVEQEVPSLSEFQRKYGHMMKDAKSQGKGVRIRKMED